MEQLLIRVVRIEDIRYVLIELDEDNLIVVFLTEDERQDFLFKIIVSLASKLKQAKWDTTIYDENALLEFVNLDGRVEVKIRRVVLIKEKEQFKREKRFFERETTFEVLKKVADALIGE